MRGSPPMLRVITGGGCCRAMILFQRLVCGILLTESGNVISAEHRLHARPSPLQALGTFAIR